MEASEGVSTSEKKLPVFRWEEAAWVVDFPDFSCATAKTIRLADILQTPHRGSPSTSRVNFLKLPNELIGFEHFFCGKSFGLIRDLLHKKLLKLE